MDDVKNIPVRIGNTIEMMTPEEFVQFCNQRERERRYNFLSLEQPEESLRIMLRDLETGNPNWGL